MRHQHRASTNEDVWRKFNISSYKYIAGIYHRHASVFNDIPLKPLPRMTMTTMMFSAKFFFLLIFISLGWTATWVRSPSRQMMIEGYDAHRVRILMYLANKGIQYIPDGTLSDFPNITVNLFDLMISMILSYPCQMHNPYQCGNVWQTFLLCKAPLRSSSVFSFLESFWTGSKYP